MPGRKRKQAKSTNDTNGSSSIIINDNAYGTSVTADGVDIDGVDDNNNDSDRNDNAAVIKAQLFVVPDTSYEEYTDDDIEALGKLEQEELTKIINNLHGITSYMPLAVFRCVSSVQYRSTRVNIMDEDEQANSKRKWYI